MPSDEGPDSPHDPAALAEAFRLPLQGSTAKLPAQGAYVQRETGLKSYDEFGAGEGQSNCLEDREDRLGHV